MKHLKVILISGGIVGFCLCSRSSLAADALTLPTEPALFASAAAGFSVYNSALVQSNDTSAIYNYSAGVFSGTSRSVGIVIEQEVGDYNFALNKSKIESRNQNVSLRYRSGQMFFGIMASNGDLTVFAPPDGNGDGYLDQGVAPKEYMRVSSSGYGAIVGSDIEIQKVASVFTDISTVEPSSVKESYLDGDGNETSTGRKDISFGRRIKLNVGGSAKLIKKILDFNFGYQHVRQPIYARTGSYLEVQNILYAGLKVRGEF